MLPDQIRLPIKKHIVKKIEDIYETYLLLHHQNHPTLSEKYGEKVDKASIDARERLLTTILWEAYQLIRSKVSNFEPWIVKVQKIIDPKTSNQFTIF